MTKTRVEGLSDINDVLRHLPRALGKATLTRFGKKRLEPMRDAAKAKAPRSEKHRQRKSKKTGEVAKRLADSIIISGKQGTPGQRRRRSADKSTVEIYMGPSQDVGQKAVPEEFGSINNPPHGYMRGAWDEHAQSLLDNLAKDLGAAVDGAAKRFTKRAEKLMAKSGG